MDADYDLKAWDEETTLGRRVFNYNYRMLGYEVKAWAMVKAVPMQKAKGITEVAYLWQSQCCARDGSGERRRVARLARRKNTC